MRIKGAKQVHYEAGPNMVPLVDVVMVILIFLMLTGSFGLSSHFFRSQAPVERTGQGGKASDKLPEGKIIVNVCDPNTDKDHAYARVDTMPARTIEDLARMLAEKRNFFAECDKDGNPAPGDKRPAPMAVQLMPVGHMDYKVIIDVYQVVAACKFPKVGFKMVPEKIEAPVRR